MENNSARLRELFKLYLDNRLTGEQYTEFWSVLNESNENILDEDLKSLWQNSGMEDVSISAEEWDYKMKMLRNIVDEKDLPVVKSIPFLSRFKWVAAAVLLIAVSTIIYLFLQSGNKNDTSSPISNESIAKTSDVSPGGNKAILVLGDGTQIILDSLNNGILGQQGGTSIVKQDGQLLYSSHDVNNSEVVYNMLSTPKGGQYKLALPDGTRVWLNAASSLKYPAVFVGKERRVEITGEAYFEVSKDVSKPFIVQVNKNLEVEVLGTHFNINSYTDEEVVKATLLEGSIKVKSGTSSGLLKPGQQAQSGNIGKIRIVNDVDLAETIAWKEGNFQFESADINYVMRQLARWYDIEVKYEGSINRHFGGTISRSVNLSKVLDMLEKTGEIKFVIEGNKVLVQP